MEPWAKRIQELLVAGKARGLTQKGLAKACGVAPPSVSQWFNHTDSKPVTQMIMADNVVAAAQYLGTSAEYIMTGHGLRVVSQPAGFDADTLAAALDITQATVEGEGLSFVASEQTDLILAAYALWMATPGTGASRAIKVSKAILDRLHAR